MLQLRRFVHFKKYFFSLKHRERDRIGTMSIDYPGSHSRPVNKIINHYLVMSLIMDGDTKNDSLSSVTDLLM